MDHLPPVKFNARVEPPFQEEPSTPEKIPPPIMKQEHETATPLVFQSDPLVEALPTILVGIGVAWAVGVATGAVIFSSPCIE